MKLKRFIFIVSSLGLINIHAHAEWGNGLGNEYKTILIPENQQSGWGVRTTPLEAAPKKIAKAVPKDDWILTGVQFDTESDQIKPESEKPLNEAAEILANHRRVAVEIQGHTDNMGDDAFNQSLSDKRAQAVKSYLIGKGIKSNRLEAKGFGESKPIADNTTDDGRSQNRRIQFKVLTK